MSKFQPLSNNEKGKLCENLGILPGEAEDLTQASIELGDPLKTHVTDGDGNCLFRALSFSICGKEEHHPYFRSVIVSYMKRNSNGKKLCPKSSKEYLEKSKMELCGTWGTDIELLAASSVFGVDIFVFTKYGKKEKWLRFQPVQNQYKVQGAIYLQHTNYNHYDCVISVNKSIANEQSEEANKEQVLEPVEISDLEEVVSGHHGTTPKTPSSQLSSSEDDIYDFNITEYNYPLSTSTPCKKGSSMIDIQSKMRNGVLETSLENSSFEEAIRNFKKSPSSHIKKRSILRQKALETSSYPQKTVCAKNCLHSLTTKEIFRMRDKLWAKPFEGRVEWFVDKVFESAQYSTPHKSIEYHIEGGHNVCGKCFRELYRLDKNFYYKYLKNANLGHSSTGIVRGRSNSKTRSSASVWLDNYSYYHADRMPDNGDLMLPYRTRKLDVYNMYRDEMTSNFKYSISQSLFYNVWNGKKHLKIKQTNSFSKCNTCVHLERELEKTRDNQARTELKKMVAVHNERQMNERQYYYMKKERAKSQPSRYMSLIIDGMDQSKTNLPHFTGRLLKGVDPNSFLKTHVQGILNHGLGTFRCYVDINEYSHDSNLVMNILLRSIHEVHKKRKTLPVILYIQADNCGRENKNKYVMSFCELLVRLHIFHEVHLSFLPVGHTHEDIDSKFSTLADLLRRNDAVTLPSLLHLLPNTTQTKGLYNIREWIEPLINHVTQHSKPLHFKFSQVDGNISLQYKSSCRKAWTTSSQSILRCMPTGKPAVLVPPHFNKIVVSSLRDNILKHKYNMDDKQFWWWNQFIDEIQRLQSDMSSVAEYARQGADWLLNDIKAHPRQENPQVIRENHLTEMIDKELDDHKIIVSSKQKKKKAESRQC